MQTLEFDQVRQQLEQLLNQVGSGTPLLITQGGQPLAKIIPVGKSEVASGTRLGFLAGSISVPDDFDQMGVAEIEQLFHGKEDRAALPERAECQVCGGRLGSAPGRQFGELWADWRSGEHQGQRYSVMLCEPCFFGVLADLRRQRMVSFMFEEDRDVPDESFGLVQVAKP
ncbi:type II toxin-antitoxin system Phd/YefM family antitoxin [Pseudomonas taiwanensis]|uniref:type II toxin-antitoxin system Phd/YefM family antitoxin n=1 Tax=Pseudomonas taiwanensis TaxID=470150 RepID=UPI0015BFEA6D|nr:type II toxin-antitoxin system prevent-host-death family antitoxin [Pseudomonas taiwanensis]